MEKTHRLRWAEMRPSERRDAAVSFIGQVLKWAFVGAMCIFTLYPVIYTLLGSFKTNAELTLAAVSCRKNGRSKTISTHSRSWSSVNIR